MIENDEFDEQVSAQCSEELWKYSKSHTYQWRGSYPLFSFRLANHGTVFPSNIHDQDICSPWLPLSSTTDQCPPHIFLSNTTPTVYSYRLKDTNPLCFSSFSWVTVMRHLSRLRHAFCHVKIYVSFLIYFSLFSWPFSVPWLYKSWFRKWHWET